jgi:hypothetical protein
MESAYDAGAESRLDSKEIDRAMEWLVQGIVEAAAFAVGKVLGRKFELDRDQGRRIGYYIIYGVIAFAGITIAILYS